MRAALHNLGCKTNSYETESMKEALKNAGFEIVDFSKETPADVYIINTCSVTNIADRKSRQMIHRANHLTRMPLLSLQAVSYRPMRKKFWKLNQLILLSAHQIRKILYQVFMSLWK